MIETPSLEKLDIFRKEGFRPGVVACVVHDNCILMLFKKDYKLWMMPQGRIKNKQQPSKALEDVIKEELGEEFASKVDYENIQFAMEDKIEFKPGRHEMGKLADDNGNEVNMLGKVYFFAVLNAKSRELDINKTVFDEHFWMSYREADFLAQKIYQQGKKRVTTKILKTLFEEGIIT